MLFLPIKMDVLKALQSVTLLEKYCISRYGVTLTSKQARMLVRTFSIFLHADPAVWLKIELIKLNCFPAECKAPPSLGRRVILHFAWKGGEMPIQLNSQPSYKFFNALGGDRRRKGRDPDFSDREYSGEPSAKTLGDL